LRRLVFDFFRIGVAEVEELLRAEVVEVRVRSWSRELAAEESIFQVPGIALDFA